MSIFAAVMSWMVVRCIKSYKKMMDIASECYPPKSEILPTKDLDDMTPNKFMNFVTEEYRLISKVSESEKKIQDLERETEEEAEKIRVASFEIEQELKEIAPIIAELEGI